MSIATVQYYVRSRMDVQGVRSTEKSISGTVDTEVKVSFGHWIDPDRCVM